MIRQLLKSSEMFKKEENIELFPIETFQISLGTKFQLKLTFWFFWPNLPKKGISSQKHKKWTSSWIPQIQMSLGSKCQLKLTILNNWTACTQKEYFWCNTENMSISIEFSIFKTVLVPNFQLKLKILIFWTNFSQKQHFSSKICKSRYQHWIPHIRSRLDNKFQLNWQILCLGPNLPEKDISALKQKNWVSPLISLYFFFFFNPLFTQKEKI